jgi:hypothetical protein
MATCDVSGPQSAKSRTHHQVKASAGQKPAGLDQALGFRDPATGRFLPGNCVWKTRLSVGRMPVFADAGALWAACVEYFCWVEDNPLYEDRLVVFQGIVSHVPVARMRAMTKRGLCLFLGIDHRTWNAWKHDRPELVPAIEQVESVIWVHKFNGAAAGLLNPNIITRELSHADNRHPMPEGSFESSTRARSRGSTFGKLVQEWDGEGQR